MARRRVAVLASIVIAVVALLLVGTPAAGAAVAPAATATAATLPVTGRAIPILGAGVAIGVALLLRLGRSKLDDGDAEDPDDPADDGPPSGV